MYCGSSYLHFWILHLDVVVTTLKCIFTTSILVELLTDTFLKLVKLSTKKTLIYFFSVLYKSLQVRNWQIWM